MSELSEGYNLVGLSQVINLVRVTTFLDVQNFRWQISFNWCFLSIRGYSRDPKSSWISIIYTNLVGELYDRLYVNKHNSLKGLLNLD